MCKICVRVDSITKMAESLYSIEDWKALLLDEFGDDPEMTDIILTDESNIWLNVIALVAAHWMLTKKIPLFPAMATISQHIMSIYANQDHIRQIKKDTDMES